MRVTFLCAAGINPRILMAILGGQAAELLGFQPASFFCVRWISKLLELNLLICPSMRENGMLGNLSSHEGGQRQITNSD